MNHPSPIAQAFDTIHEEFRRLQRESMEHRAKINQLTAALGMVREERDDLKKRVGQLIGQSARIRASLAGGAQAEEIDVTDQVQFFDEGKQA